MEAQILACVVIVVAGVANHSVRNDSSAKGTFLSLVTAGTAIGAALHLVAPVLF